MKQALTLLVVSLSCQAALAQHIAVAPFTGSNGAASRNQIVSTLCEAATCVSQSKVLSNGKPDWKKLGKEKVDYLVQGKVGDEGVELSVLTKPSAVKFKKVFPLDGSELTPRNLQAATSALLKAMGIDEKTSTTVPDPTPVEKPREREPTPVAETPPARETPREREAPPPEPPAETSRRSSKPPPREEAETTASDRDGSDRESTREEGSERTAPILVAELSLAPFHREFGYSDLETPNLVPYIAPFAFGIRAGAEFYPVAIAKPDSAVAGLGLELSLWTALGLQSRKTGLPNVAYPTALNAIDVAVRFRWLASDALGLTVAPIFGFRSTNFSTGKASDGTIIDGLPGISYASLRLGLKGEVPFLDGRMNAMLRFAILPTLGLGEIGAAGFFKSAGAFGIDFGAGAGFVVWGGLEARLEFWLTRFGLGFTVDPTDVYRAKGASDLMLGFNAGARYTF